MLRGPVVSETGTPLEATLGLATDDGVVIASVDTDGEGWWALPILAGSPVENVLRASVVAPGYAEGLARIEVDLQDWQLDTISADMGESWSPIEVRMPAIRLADEAAAATATCTLRGALDGAPVGAEAELRRGWNAAEDEPMVDALRAGPDGVLRLEADAPGMYTVRVAANGDRSDARFPAMLAGGTDCNGWIAPVLGATELLVTVGWSGPLDLDLHVSAPLKGGQAGADGTGRYHVWSQEPTQPERPEEDGGYEAEVSPIVASAPGGESVRVDDVTSTEGVARVTVFDMSNRSDADSRSMAEGDPVVQAWTGGAARFYSMAPGTTATSWTAAEIDGPSGRSYRVEGYSVGGQPGDPTGF
jgi:hypothetical protein